MKAKTGKKKSLWREIWKNKAVYLIMLPGIAWFILFAYGPMSGLQLAFKTYSMKLGIWGSPWCGLENFEYVFRDPSFLKSVGTTLWINAGRLIFQFPIPVILALLMNELRLKRYKKVVQTVLTFPQFLSWVIVASIVINILSYDGLVEQHHRSHGRRHREFHRKCQSFPAAAVHYRKLEICWLERHHLYGAISGIDMDQYEAADLDGASRIQKIFRITLPNILPTVSVMFVLQMGSLMSGGFDQIFNLSNPAVKDVSEILDMYIYDITFGSTPDFSFSTAVSFFRSVVNCAFLVAADRGRQGAGRKRPVRLKKGGSIKWQKYIR